MWYQVCVFIMAIQSNPRLPHIFSKAIKFDKLLGGHIGIMLAPRARGLWFDPPTNLK